MRATSGADQRYYAVRAVIADGATVTSVAVRFGPFRRRRSCSVPSSPATARRTQLGQLCVRLR